MVFFLSKIFLCKKLLVFLCPSLILIVRSESLNFLFYSLALSVEDQYRPSVLTNTHPFAQYIVIHLMVKTHLDQVEAKMIHFVTPANDTLAARGCAIQLTSMEMLLACPRTQPSSSSLHESNPIFFSDHDLVSIASLHNDTFIITLQVENFSVAHILINTR